MVINTSVKLAFVVVPGANISAPILPTFFEPIDSLQFDISTLNSGELYTSRTYVESAKHRLEMDVHDSISTRFVNLQSLDRTKLSRD